MRDAVMSEPAAWSTTITEYTLEEVEQLQNWVKANPQSVMTGLLCFVRDARRVVTVEEVLTIWGPMAERMFSGQDVVAEFKAMAPAKNWTTKPA